MRYQSWWGGMGLVLSVVGGTLAASLAFPSWPRTTRSFSISG
jgi:hypothetical protein